MYRIIGQSPTSNYINVPKLSSQSLNLTGRYIYILFRPVPNKCFALHVDVVTEDKLTVRLSFSNLFKEFKATTTWLQFPYVIAPPNGSIYELTAAQAKDHSGVAPPLTKWTVLCVDLASVTQQFATRKYASVRSYKLCSSMLVKNVVTSDNVYEPGLSLAEAKLRGVTSSAFPREFAFPCDKSANWYALYDYVTFPTDSFRGKTNRGGGQACIVANKNINNTEVSDLLQEKSQENDTYS